MKIKQIKNCTLEELKTYAKNNKIDFANLCNSGEKEIDLDSSYKEPQVDKSQLENFINDMEELGFEIEVRKDQKYESVLKFRKPHNFSWKIDVIFTYEEKENYRSITIDLTECDSLGINVYEYDLYSMSSLKEFEKTLQKDIKDMLYKGQQALEDLEDFTKGVDKLRRKYGMRIDD